MCPPVPCESDIKSKASVFRKRRVRFEIEWCVFDRDTEVEVDHEGHLALIESSNDRYQDCMASGEHQVLREADDLLVLT